MLDQLTSSASNFIVLLVAARVLDGTQLSHFALFQALAMAAVGFQRTVILVPALASQRSAGQTWIPRRWAVAGASSCLGVVAPFICLAAALAGGSGKSTALALLTVLFILVQDFMRYRVLSAEHVGRVLAADATWLFVTGTLLVVMASSGTRQTPTSVAICWGVGAIVGIALLLQNFRDVNASRARFRDVWRLGRWATVDALLAMFISVAPLFISAIAIGGSLAGIYRSLQTVASPLNLVFTTMTLGFGLSAWRMARDDGSAELELRRRVKSAYRVVLPLAAGVALLMPLVLLVYGIELTRQSLWACVAVGASAMLGAWISPKLSIAMAFGYQRHAAVIRGVLVVVTCAITAGALLGVRPMNVDPVGISLVASGVVGVICWEIAFRRALRLESDSAVWP